MAAAPPATTRIRVLPHPQLCEPGLVVDVPSRGSLLDALLEAGLAIEHACEKVGACATCHVHVRSGGDALVPADDDEEDQLGSAWGLDPQSRLACQVRLRSVVELVVELPRFSRNHARER